MNRHTLSAEARNWWWPPATAGVAATSAIAMITLIPATTYATPTEHHNVPSAASAPVTDNADASRYHPCFMGRHNWNDAVAGPPPICLVVGSDADHGQPQRIAHARQGLRYVNLIA